MSRNNQTKEHFKISTRGTIGGHKVDEVVIAGGFNPKEKTGEFLFDPIKGLFRSKKSSVSKSNLLDGKDLTC
ncbi:MAG: hypothetical protein PHR96_02775 [Clostridia bacterium]|nr:hypothetical protein [Clostridia bacterium]